MRVLATVAILFGLFSPAHAQARAADDVTVKGILLSSWNYYQHKMPRNQSPKGTREKFDLVLYAFDGPAEVRKTLADILAEYYPEEGLDAPHATRLQEQFDARLRYTVDTGDEATQQKLLYGHTWGINPATVSGKLEERLGRKWLTGAKVTVEKRVSPSFKYPPDCMLRPDKPFVMPKEKPIDLVIGEGLSLRCVPIPPGTFIMGSPFYQMPRFQDECPHEVVLTKTFYLSEIPVTQAMFERVCGAEKNRSRNRGPDFAVENTPFPDIREFCRIVSEKNGRVVRVPTAAEMEYVARLGTSNPCFPPKYAPRRTNVGAQKGNVPVRSGKPNAWGVYDIPAWGVTALSDWKAPNRPDRQVDPQGEPFDSPWVYWDHAIVSVQKVTRPVEGMIMKGKYPAVHKGSFGSDWDRPNLHDRYSEDGLDGGNGTSWVGIFRVVVEAEAPAGTGKPEFEGPREKDGIEIWVVTSDYQEKPCNLHVLLLDKFDKAKRYRALYILPALGPNETEGIREAKKLDLANKHNIICVAPDFTRMPWYADLPGNPKVRYDSYLPDVIVPFIDRTYPTVAKPEGRLLVGFSKSGIGAVSLLLRHPDVFGRAGAWDAPLMENHTRPEFFGPQEHFLKNYHIPTLLNRRLEMLKGKPARLAIAGHGWGGVEPAHKLMEQLGIPHYYSGLPRSEHEWKSGWLGPLVGVLMSDDMTRAR